MKSGYVEKWGREGGATGKETKKIYQIKKKNWKDN